MRSITPQDITNITRKHRYAKRQGQSPIGWLSTQLDDQAKFWYRMLPEDIDQNAEQHVTGLFIAPMSSVRLLRQHPDMVQMDCTYKTNRFAMPMLSICGSTNDRITFQIAACFLSGEKQADYTWAIECLGNFYVQYNIPRPRSMCTDRELALIGSLRTNPIFQQIPRLMCR